MPPPPNELQKVQSAWQLFRHWINDVLPVQVGILANLRDKLK